MVLDYSQMRLRVLMPDLSTPISYTIKARIDPDTIEVANVYDHDIPGDGTFTYPVPASFDISGATLRYRMLVTSGFANVGSDEFNGYAMTFAKLSNPENRTSLYAVDIVEGQTTFSIPREYISFDKDSLFINVDALFGTAGQELVLRMGFAINGTAKANQLQGDEGRDKIIGFAGNDTLFGGNGADRMDGGDGADTLNGGRGADTLIGGLGRDTFVLREGSGNELVTDFQNGIDRILIRTSDDRFADLTIIEVEAGVRIRSDGATILLRGADLSDINAADFIF